MLSKGESKVEMYEKKINLLVFDDSNCSAQRKFEPKFYFIFKCVTL